MWRISTGSIERRDLREWQKVFLGREVFGNLCSVAAASVCSGFTTAVAAVDQYLRITNSLHTMPPQARSKRLSHLTTSLSLLSPPSGNALPCQRIPDYFLFVFETSEIAWSPCKPLFIFNACAMTQSGRCCERVAGSGLPINAEAVTALAKLSRR